MELLNEQAKMYHAELRCKPLLPDDVMKALNENRDQAKKDAELIAKLAKKGESQDIAASQDSDDITMLFSQDVHSKEAERIGMVDKITNDEENKQELVIQTANDEIAIFNQHDQPMKDTQFSAMMDQIEQEEQTKQGITSPGASINEMITSQRTLSKEEEAIIMVNQGKEDELKQESSPPEASGDAIMISQSQPQTSQVSTDVLNDIAARLAQLETDFPGFHFNTVLPK